MHTVRYFHSIIIALTLLTLFSHFNELNPVRTIQNCVCIFRYDSTIASFLSHSRQLHSLFFSNCLSKLVFFLSVCIVVYNFRNGSQSSDVDPIYLCAIFHMRNCNCLGTIMHLTFFYAKSHLIPSLTLRIFVHFGWFSAFSAP